MDLIFSVHKLAKVSANPGKVQSEVLVNLLRYIKDNKTLGLKYYADLNDAPVTDLLRKANILDIFIVYKSGLKFCSTQVSKIFS